MFLDLCFHLTWTTCICASSFLWALDYKKNECVSEVILKIVKYVLKLKHLIQYGLALNTDMLVELYTFQCYSLHIEQKLTIGTPVKFYMHFWSLKLEEEKEEKYPSDRQQLPLLVQFQKRLRYVMMCKNNSAPTVCRNFKVYL